MLGPGVQVSHWHEKLKLVFFAVIASLKIELLIAQAWNSKFCFFFFFFLIQEILEVKTMLTIIWDDPSVCEMKELINKKNDWFKVMEVEVQY